MNKKIEKITLLSGKVIEIEVKDVFGVTEPKVIILRNKKEKQISEKWKNVKL